MRRLVFIPILMFAGVIQAYTQKDLSQNGGIAFQHGLSWAEILQKAKKENKYIFVDCYASWCGPCRAENPNVVKAYSEFKGKNFAILGVSLDKEKNAWQEAIRSDNLNWNQVSDLKFWSSKAVETFKFDGIPFNVLIDPQGKVIAESLRGDDLENKLKEVLN